MKALLLLVLARRPRLLVLDEPTSGLDPVARHEVIAELMDVLQDDQRSILFSSHNTVDVEQISDQITFIDRGHIVDSNDKETFVEQWRRISVDVPAGVALPALPGIVDVARSGRIAVVTTNAFEPRMTEALASAGADVRDLQRMTLRGNLRRQRPAQTKGAWRMNRSITGRLVAKDLYLYRPLIACALVAGVASLVLSRFSAGDHVSTGVNAGVVLFMTTIIAFGIFIAMGGILKERQDRSQLFVLSLPIAPAQYAMAKVGAALIAFLVPWIV
ncbi:MAG TPA: AAA family ATPase [Thermoanaerobaculia bacterium]|nr:AAA family ATPase [Thermoanaerobaculia bacterium]